MTKIESYTLDKLFKVCYTVVIKVRKGKKQKEKKQHLKSKKIKSELTKQLALGLNHLASRTGDQIKDYGPKPHGDSKVTTLKRFQ